MFQFYVYQLQWHRAEQVLASSWQCFVLSPCRVQLLTVEHCMLSDIKNITTDSKC